MKKIVTLISLGVILSFTSLVWIPISLYLVATQTMIGILTLLYSSTWLVYKTNFENSDYRLDMKSNDRTFVEILKKEK
jgi:hypothetical protein